MLHAAQIRQAISALAAMLPPDAVGEMVLIGGGAGVLAGELPQGRLTADLDVIAVEPPEVLDLCCHHAPAIAARLGLSDEWFDATPRSLQHMLLPGWRARTVEVGEFGSLRVRSIGRSDLIALKTLAGRERDLQDLQSLAIDREEAAQVARELPQLLAQGVDPEQVERAIALARAMAEADVDHRA